MSTDDDSKNAQESEVDTGQPDRLNLVESRLDSMSEYMERLEERLGQQAAERQQHRESVDAEFDAMKQSLADLRGRLADLEERTDMQRLVERADDTTARQRILALQQHLVRKARNNGDKASLDRDGAMEALHHPDIHRTQPYTDMSDVAKRFPDDICRYKDGELQLDLSNVDGPLSQHTKSVKVSQQSDGVSGGQTAPESGGKDKLG